ncbi:MAG: hypothetical protein ACTHMJ_12920, partial [Thermomicrobiales bacterium]
MNRTTSQPSITIGIRLAAMIFLALLALLAPGLGRGQTALAAGSPQSVTFNCLGIPVPFIVPPGVTQLYVLATGAAGSDLSAGGNPGKGGAVSANLAVTPGQTLNVTVGCRNGYGWSRGGPGGPTSTFPYGFSGGANGGGSTAIVAGTSTTPLLVVAGGGGGGGTGVTSFYTGGDGGDGFAPGYGAGNGSNGTGPGAGAGGAGGGNSTADGAAGDPADNGSGGGGGGGGGGGYPHGGARGEGGASGGGGGGGGGAGQTFADPAVVSVVSMGPDDQAEDGKVTFIYTGP